MSDYIKRNDALGLAYNISEKGGSANNVYFGLKQLKVADVAPVRHGRWMKTGAYPHRVYCSVCSKTYAQAHWEVWKDGSLARAYCPNCGARMDGEDE